MSERSQFVPKGLRVTAERLAAFTRNRFRIENAGSNVGKPGQTITVTLPSNTLVDLHSLKMHSRLETAGSYFRGNTTNSSPSDPGQPTDYAEASYRVVAPEDPHQLIDRMTISMNGTAVQQGCLDYATVHKVKSLLDKPIPKRASVDEALCMGGTGRPHPSSYQASQIQTMASTGLKATQLNEWATLVVSTGNNGDARFNGNVNLQNPKNQLVKAKTGNAHLANNNTCEDVLLYDWRGFLKESSVRYLPTDLVGAVQIQLTLAPVSRLVTIGSEKDGSLRSGAEMDAYVANTWDQPPDYQFAEIYWTIDTISVDQTYGDMLRGKIAQFGFISLIFKEYYTFQKSGWDANTTDNHRFSLSTGSLDKMYTVLRTGTGNHGKPDSLMANEAGYQLADPTMGTTWTPWLHFVAPYVDLVWNYGLLGKESPRPEWHFLNDCDLKYNYKINSVMHPQYEATVRDAIWDCFYSHDMVDGHHAGSQITNRAVWADTAAIFPCCLNLTDGPLQLMSGYDSRGHSSFVEFNLSGMYPDNYKKTEGGAAKKAMPSLTTTSICETSSELRVGAGLSLAVSR